MLLLSNCNMVITVPSSSHRYCCCVFATVLIIVVVVYVITVVGVVAFWECDIARLQVETNYELMQSTKEKRDR